MSKLKDIWKNKHLIAEGIKNKIFTNSDVEEVYHERLAICKGCQKFDSEGTNCTVPKTNPCCGECGCSLALKLRSLASACPLENPKWEAVVSQEEAQEIKKVVNQNLKNKK